MTTTLIPCKRPKVTIEAHEKTTYSGRIALYHLASCHVPGCRWSYDAAVKTDAEDQAKWHRADHRAAVPAIERTGTGFTHEASCPQHGLICHGTRTDVEASIAHHLAAEHGLVTCP